jgi:hypothetical protein
MSSPHDELVQIADYLFDKGFTINKPLCMAIVEYYSPILTAKYEQGKRYSPSMTVSEIILEDKK